ncbi:MAG: ABC transporter ATP-binding protein/permease, partial [Rickettsiales bacterium]|nr:ABC transporter ATP-binding protein/permease [Rickettsiales bacterium]
MKGGKTRLTVLPHGVFAFIWHFLSKRKWLFWAQVVLIFLRGASNMAWPYSIKMLADAFGRATPETVWESVRAVLFLYFSIYAAHILVNRVYKLIGNYFYPAMSTAVRSEVVSGIQSKSFSFFINNFTGSMVNKIGDLTRESRELTKLSLWILEIWAFVFAGFAMFAPIHWGITAVCCAWIFAHISFCLFRLRTWNKLAYDTSEAASAVTGRIADSLSNYGSVKSFAREKAERRYIMPFLMDRQRKDTKWGRTINRDYLLLDFLSFFGLYVPVFAMIIALYRNGTVGVGSILFVTTAVDWINGRIYDLGDKLSAFSESYGTMKQAMWVVTAPLEIEDAKGAAELKVKDAVIEFDRVRFRYDSRRDVLFDGFGLKIGSGEKVGLVGSSGAGKSSIIHLLLRYFDVQGGAILIDGQDIRGVTQESLRRAIAFIPQDTSLFHRTIRDNIAYGRQDAAQAEVESAARKAYAHELIMGTPDGYSSLVGDRGIKLSVGQRQRIAI